MSSISSRTPSLTPSKSPSPEPPAQPDHFYGGGEIHHLPPTPDSQGRSYLNPSDDPLATRGIPVFKPTMDEFRDFEAYMVKVEPWGMRSGIVKIIPPKEWTDALPTITKEQFAEVKIKSPIEQNMFGRAGLYRQENLVKRKAMSVREWVELCNKEDFRAPSIGDMGLRYQTIPKTRRSRRNAVKVESGDSELPGEQVHIKEEVMDDAFPILKEGMMPSDTPNVREELEESKPKQGKGKKQPSTRESRQAEKEALDDAFLDTFDYRKDWLPPNTKASDYTPEVCHELERTYWKNCSLGKPAWYGADSQGTLYTDETTSWNVGHLQSALSRLLPPGKGLPGVNTPYLYWGMWKATFAWHVEDMDLFSINYVHFGAPKFWYAMPQAKANALESAMRGWFPRYTSECPQFLRHKSFWASPKLLTNASCKPNCVVQQAGEFIITYPRGYHAGFNLGLNCAESVNFALDSWIELGKKAKACECIDDSVKIDVEQLLADREYEAIHGLPPPSPPPEPAPKKRAAPVKKEPVTATIPKSAAAPTKGTKRKAPGATDGAPPAKKIRVKPSASTTVPTTTPIASSSKAKVTLKLPPPPEVYPCCLCVSMSKEGLLRVNDPPLTRKDAVEAAGNPEVWMAHEICASVVPDTWVDHLESGEKVVFGVDGIVKDRWNLKCAACTKARSKAHGAPIQCTKGKCPKAFHVCCARDGGEQNIVFNVIREVEKEVMLFDPQPPPMQVDSGWNYYPEDAPSRVLKTIRKLEVQVLCPQHNPAVAAAKKASKQDKIRSDLLTLPSMSRIKIRVSSGVFEVSLLRVIEETGSVEVLWDRGVKREFKWGSVHLGALDGPVQQKPSELGAGPLVPHYNHRPSMNLTMTPGSTFTYDSTVYQMPPQPLSATSTSSSVSTPMPLSYEQFFAAQGTLAASMTSSHNSQCAPNPHQSARPTPSTPQYPTPPASTPTASPYPIPSPASSYVTQPASTSTSTQSSNPTPPHYPPPQSSTPASSPTYQSTFHSNVAPGSQYVSSTTAQSYGQSDAAQRHQAYWAQYQRMLAQAPPPAPTPTPAPTTYTQPGYYGSYSVHNAGSGPSMVYSGYNTGTPSLQWKQPYQGPPGSTSQPRSAHVQQQTSSVSQEPEPHSQPTEMPAVAPEPADQPVHDPVAMEVGS